MKPYVFGADIGGTSVKLGFFSADGALIEKWEIPTRTENGGEAILPDVAASVREAMARHGIAGGQVEGIGIAVPGPVDAAGVVYKCVNLGWGVFSIRERMRELLPEIPVVAAGNDANVAALGELWQGGGRGYRSAVMITLGTGVGGGVVLDGKIVAGKNGGAGEIGHITVEPEETLECTCGKRGCLEQYASARGVADLAKRMLAECNTPSALRDLGDFTAKELCEQAERGDVMALSVLERFGDYLGRAMSFISCTVDPDVYIIGGGMSRAGEIVLAPVRKAYRKYAFHVSAGTDAVIADLGNDAGIYGCAKMVLPE
ncbi:MAG: ROK family glucokinase [Ruminococcaceae bacterium]|nr:ROK family glucokinase [Oscillospiraceae bacterium]